MAIRGAFTGLATIRHQSHQFTAIQCRLDLEYAVDVGFGCVDDMPKQLRLRRTERGICLGPRSLIHEHTQTDTGTVITDTTQQFETAQMRDQQYRAATA